MLKEVSDRFSSVLRDIADERMYAGKEHYRIESAHYGKEISEPRQGAAGFQGTGYSVDTSS